MARSKQVRWECPSGKHRAVLASTRPRANATAWFCLRCSEEQGVLVERVAPALVRRRAARAERARARARRLRAVAASRWIVEVREADGSTGTLDVIAEVYRMMRLREVRAVAVTRRRPEITLHRTRSQGGFSGRGWPQWRVHFSIGQLVSRQSLEEIILHEVLHYVLPGGVSHGPAFRKALLRAAAELYPCIVVRNEGEVYAMCARVRAEMRRVAKGAVQASEEAAA